MSPKITSQDSWRQLRQGGRLPGAATLPTIASSVRADDGPVRYALGPNGEARLLLPVRQSERTSQIPETSALKILADSYVVEGSSGRFLDLTCVVSELEEVFAQVADQIVARVSEGHSSMLACTLTLDEFRLLLTEGNVVTSSVVTGLAGELVLLNTLLDRNADACSLWRGPLGERHDFRCGTLALEVKTTVRAGNQLLTVTSIDQMLEPLGGELYLVRQILEPAAGGRLSIGSLFASAVAKSASPQVLRSLMVRVGCSDPYATSWNLQGFELQETKAYRVGPRFPRIIPASFLGGALPQGTSEVAYTIDLGVARNCQVEPGEFESLLQRMSECSPPV